MAQFKVIPPETGTANVSLRCWSNRPGAPGAPSAPRLRCPLRGRASLHYRGTSSAECIQCRTTGDGLLLSVRWGNTSLISFLLLSLPKQLLHSTSSICKPCCKSLAFRFFFFKGEKKVDDSLRLKSCAIQQMNFLFCFLSLLIYRIQLNIIEAGSWFAVWAI